MLPRPEFSWTGDAPGYADATMQRCGDAAPQRRGDAALRPMRPMRPKRDARMRRRGDFSSR
jgi:hypothetical protein